MDVTVCICTHDRPGYLSDCLEGLRQQTVGDERFDILVVDSASTGDVPAQLARLVRGLRNARLLRVARAGVSVARNTGAREAAGDYIAYIDDDAIPDPDWIERILAAIGEADPPPAMIGGRILPQWEAPLPFWWPPSLRGSLSIIEVEGQGPMRSASFVPRSAGMRPLRPNARVGSRRAAVPLAGKAPKFGDALNMVIWPRLLPDLPCVALPVAHPVHRLA
jgi:glucosyl-dolichyl phosphate glucuronosyltransferase